MADGVDADRGSLRRVLECLAMVIGGSGQLSSLRDINKASAAPLCTHIRGFCKPSPQRRLLQLHVRAADKDVGENGIRPAKQQSFNNRKASGNVPRMQEAGKQQKGRAANRRPAKAKGTEVLTNRAHRHICDFATPNKSEVDRYLQIS